MSIKIRFDNNNMPIEPTFVLMTRSGKKLGAINANNINATDKLKDCSELFFSVEKRDAENIWDDLVDFKLVWAREWNQVYEIYVEYKESQDYVKNVTAKSLGHAELSQIKIYDMNINNDIDIENDDVRTVLYDQSDANHSLLNRIIDEKAPHYSIGHVDTWLRSIQRTFEWDNSNILEVFHQIEEEIGCIILINTSIDGTNGELQRVINVYDLEYYCEDCNYRGNYTEVCPKCDGTNILPGYGDDTTIFVSADNLSDEIDLSVNTDSVKNCFKLEAGDDLMTATVINCNPNGSQYIWYITDETKADMPSELVEKIEDYDEVYEDYQNTHSYDLSSAVSDYNSVANIYKQYNSSLKNITSPVSGFQSLMEVYYDVIDLSIYVSDKCMPVVTVPETTASLQAALLTSSSLSPVSVQNMSVVSTATATSSVLAIAKTIVNGNYGITATADGDISNSTWRGRFTVTNYADESDTATSGVISVTLNDDYVDYVKQRITKMLASDDDDGENKYGIVALFNKTLSSFTSELKKYNLSALKMLEGCCQSCLDLLISIGAANAKTWYDDANNDDDDPVGSQYDNDVSAVSYLGASPTGGLINYYRSFYKPYYKRLTAIQDEIVVRESELKKVANMMALIDEKVSETQEALNFGEYLGDELWEVFSSYRRDDVYSNNNFISDGLDNADLFAIAREFLADATKEIYKSATLQHSITATLNNLLVIKEFAPIVDYFKVGNWIRIKIADDIYKLRLLSYSIDFDNLKNISVEFSDITRMIDGVSDIESLLNSANSMATSYDYVKRQSKKGYAGNEQLRHWVEDGLSLTTLKIVNTAEEQDIALDDHGILAREYLPITDEYDNRQLKIINRGLYVTDDNWRTSKAGVGNFLFYDPEEERVVEGYGVIADTIVGKIILGQQVGIYNTEGSVVINEDGMKICADMTYDDTTDTMFKIQRKVTADNEDGYEIQDLLALNSDGQLVLNGTLSVYTGGNGSGSGSTTPLSDLQTGDDVDAKINAANAALNSTINNSINSTVSEITTLIDNKLYNLTGGDGSGSISQMIRDSADSLMAYTDSRLSQALRPVDAYLEMTESGLKIGAENSSFYTLITNSSMEFCQNNEIVAYISDQHLYINNATINSRLMVGNYFFSTNADDGMTIVWIEEGSEV